MFNKRGKMSQYQKRFFSIKCRSGEIDFQVNLVTMVTYVLRKSAIVKPKKVPKVFLQMVTSRQFFGVLLCHQSEDLRGL